jgi:hypothetical protein
VIPNKSGAANKTAVDAPNSIALGHFKHLQKNNPYPVMKIFVFAFALLVLRLLNSHRCSFIERHEIISSITCVI